MLYKIFFIHVLVYLISQILMLLICIEPRAFHFLPLRHQASLLLRSSLATWIQMEWVSLFSAEFTSILLKWVCKTHFFKEIPYKDMANGHRKNVLVTSCLKTPVDPHTKAPLASYERERVLPCTVTGDIDNRNYEKEVMLTLLSFNGGVHISNISLLFKNVFFSLADPFYWYSKRGDATGSTVFANSDYNAVFPQRWDYLPGAGKMRSKSL